VGKVQNCSSRARFSKAYGLANLRIYLLGGNAALMRYVRK